TRSCGFCNTTDRSSKPRCARNLPTSIPKEFAPVTDTHTAAPVSPPVARSPLASAGEVILVDGWEYFSGAGEGPVVVADRSALSKVQVKAEATAALVEALGTRFGRTAWVRGRLVTGSGP